MATTNPLTDTLLQDLMAAGQADILVGLPTLNNAQTVGQVAYAVYCAFAGPFGRERTVLINPDGGSTDGTQEAVRRAGPVTGDLFTTQYALRTIHRIAAPYHGVPGRGTALRLIFTAADLLRARAVLVLDPEAVTLTVEDIERWVAPVLRADADYVKPVLPRGPCDGPLVTQLVRPLLRATYGKRLLEPVDTQLACSGRFATDALARELWATPYTNFGLDVWLSAMAMAGGYHLAQIRTAARGQPSRERRLPISDVFGQVISAVLACLAHDARHWLAVRGSEEVSVYGIPGAVEPSSSGFDPVGLTTTYREALDALRPMLVSVIDSATLDELEAAARTEQPHIADHLWVRTVYAFVASAIRASLPVGQLAQLLEPLYLGRLASMIASTALRGSGAAMAELEGLARTFEEHKAELIAHDAFLRRGEP